MTMEEWSETKANEIISELMLSNDAFSKWLGVRVDLVKESSVEISCNITETMTNGFHVAHGGIVFSLCDSALAFHSNSWGRKALSIETSINHLSPIRVGEKITAKTSIIKVGKSIGNFLIEAYNQDDKKVAIMKGMVFYLGDRWA